MTDIVSVPYQHTERKVIDLIKRIVIFYLHHIFLLFQHEKMVAVNMHIRLMSLTLL